MRFRIVSLFILLFGSFHAPSFGQPPASPASSGQALRAAIDSLEPAQRQPMIETRKQVYPVFIFIPGILGSKLTKVDGANKEEVIWGQINLRDLLSKPNAAIAYKDTDHVKAEPLDTFYVSGYGKDVYGDAIARLKGLNPANSENVLWFAYDWRQSNRKSAAKLSEWLCEPKQRSKIEGNKVVFIAHSMGGLVLKFWLKHFYDGDGCSAGKFSEWLKVRQLVFAGTPSFGTAQAALALGTGTTLWVDSTRRGAFWKELANIDAATLSKSLNAYGIYFPSAYELLPVLHRTDSNNGCISVQRDRASIQVKPRAGDIRPADIFSEQTWREFGWPRALGGEDREKFLVQDLPNLLASALEFLCDVGSYRPEARFDVTRFVGNKTDTVCLITLVQPSRPSMPYEVSDQDALCRGDGTVPEWIAKEISVSSRGLSRPDSQAHDSLLGDQDFLSYIDDLGADLLDEFGAEALKRDKAAALETLQKISYPLPTPGDKTQENDVAKVAAAKTAEGLGVKVSELFRVAANTEKNQTKSLDRAIAYRQAAEIGETGQVNRAWALNNSAGIYLDRKNYKNARGLGIRAIDLAEKITDPNAQSKVRDIKSKAAWTVAKASKELGQDSDAKKFRELALKFGNPFAQQNNLGLNATQ